MKTLSSISLQSLACTHSQYFDVKNGQKLSMHNVRERLMQSARLQRLFTLASVSKQIWQKRLSTTKSMICLRGRWGVGNKLAMAAAYIRRPAEELEL